MPISKSPRAGKAKNLRTHGVPMKQKNEMTNHVMAARVQCENARHLAGTISLRLLDSNLIRYGNTQELSTISVVFSKDLFDHRQRLESIHSMINRPLREGNQSDMFKASSVVQQYLEWIESFEAVIEPSILRIGMLLTEAEENMNRALAGVQ